jgi:hypothetical protein
VFVLGRHFSPSLLSVKKLTSDKRSSLFVPNVSDEEKSFISLTPGFQGNNFLHFSLLEARAIPFSRETDSRFCNKLERLSMHTLEQNARVLATL